MKKILLVGAGRSSAVLVKYLVGLCEERNWQLLVGDVSESVAREKTGGHPATRAFRFDVNDNDIRNREVQHADLVISLLPPHLHLLLATDCVRFGKPFLTASYLSPEIKSLDEAAQHAGVLLLNECGLDPGIDHMSAMEIIHNLQQEGNELIAFSSYTGGLVAPESNDNPWGYKFSWNPRNVILAGQGTARFISKGQYKYIPYNRIFSDIQTIEVEDLGKLDGYANRDSLSYRHLYGIETIPTLLRGTLRQQGFCRAWDVFVKLGLTDDTFKIERSAELTYAQLVSAFIPEKFRKESLVDSVAAFCGLPPDGEAMSKVIWTGIFEDELIGTDNATPATILQGLLEKKWQLRPHDKDMIVMQHQFEYRKAGNTQHLLSSLVIIGDDPVHTAMAKTVGLPLGIAAKLILDSTISLTGVHIPVQKAIYQPILNELQAFGIVFRNKII